MKNRKCPSHKHCKDYGLCETCSIGNEILKLHKRIDRLKKQNEKLTDQWISVEERLPEKSGEVLTYRPNFVTVMDYSIKHKAFNAFDDLESASYAIEVTHWMPLPKPPKEHR